MSEDTLIEIAQETQIEARGRKFEVAREVVPFDKLMEMSTMLANSTIIPVAFQKRPENCFIAMDMASRMGISPMLLMQNLFIIQGKPSLSGQFIGALLRSTPSLRNVTLHYVGTEKTDTYGAYVTAERATTGEVLKGATVTMATARLEGWSTKPQSKWLTMPTLMLSYRAHTWFARQYTPELLMGLQSSDEIDDIQVVEVEAKDPFVEV